MEFIGFLSMTSFFLFVLVFVSWKNDSVVDNNDNEEEENKFVDKIRTRT